MITITSKIHKCNKKIDLDHDPVEHVTVDEFRERMASIRGLLVSQNDFGGLLNVIVFKSKSNQKEERREQTKRK